MKKGKELKISNFKNHNVIIGSIDNKHSKSVYVNISSWAEPKFENEGGYNRIIKDMNKKIKQSLFNLLSNGEYNDFLPDRTIVDLDMKESGVRFGKRSFLNYEITLFSDSELPINSEYIKPILDDIISKLIVSILEPNKYFNFYKRKK